MASRKLTASVLVLSLLLSSTLSSVCDSCKPAPRIGPPAPAPAPAASCPKDTSKFGACSGFLGATNIVAGSPPYSHFCDLLSGLGKLDTAVCLCIATKANVLGVVPLNLPNATHLLLSRCDRPIPKGFKCE